jgi:hypothetical protein
LFCKKISISLKFSSGIPISEKVDGYEGGLQVNKSDRFPAAETYFNQKIIFLRQIMTFGFFIGFQRIRIRLFGVVVKS